MPDGLTSIPVSVRVPTDMIETLDTIAAAMDRSRSWIILDAIREYLAGIGAEVLDVRESIAALDRGEGIPLDEVQAEMREKIAVAKSTSR